MFKTLLVILLLLTSSIAHEKDRGVMPENSMKISVFDKQNTMTEETFNKTIDNIEKAYTDIIKNDYNADLSIIRKWEDDTVNAYANRSGKTWIITMFGGLARHKSITPDGFATVVCHELGHHIGGAPKKTLVFVTWPSIEGQSDYFATNKCLKKVFSEEIDLTLTLLDLAESDEEVYAAAECNKIFKSIEDIALCYRTAIAGMSLAEMLKDVSGYDKTLSLTTPDPAVVSETYTSHPAAQCRLDTYFAGALCDTPFDVLTSSTDPKVGYCYLDRYTVGVRPTCWFKQ